jgi:hypothetical protein
MGLLRADGRIAMGLLFRLLLVLQNAADGGEKLAMHDVNVSTNEEFKRPTLRRVGG